MAMPRPRLGYHGYGLCPATGTGKLIHLMRCILPYSERFAFVIRYNDFVRWRLFAVP